MRISLALAWIGLLLAGIERGLRRRCRRRLVDFGGSDNVINLQA